MPRYSRLTEADVAGLQARGPAHRVASPTRPSRSPSASTRLDGVTPTPTGYLLRYSGWLPKINGHQVHRLSRSRLTKRARLVFGVLPPFLCATQRAQVEIIRVLGPRQKPMDPDSIALLTGALLDSLKPSYLRDDAEAWIGSPTYRNDASRRHEGPAVEIMIRYGDETE